jgi:hypothetical protein
MISRIAAPTKLSSETSNIPISQQPILRVSWALEKFAQHHAPAKDYVGSIPETTFATR